MKRKLNLPIVAFVLLAGGLFLGAGVGKAEAACPSGACYVSLSGSDAAVGAIDTPLKSLEYAIETKSIAGDSIILSSGTYETTNIWASGSDKVIDTNKTLTLSANSGETVTVNIPSDVNPGFGLFRFGGTFTVNNINFTNTNSYGFFFFQTMWNTQSANLTINGGSLDINNVISNNSIRIDTHLTAYNAAVTLDNVVIKNGALNAGVIFSGIGGGKTTTITVRGCLIHHVGWLKSASNATNIIAINNTFANLKNKNTINAVASTDIVVLKNNIFRGDDTYSSPIFVSNFIPTNWTVQNNIIYRPTTLDPGAEAQTLNSIATIPGDPPSELFPLDATNYYLDPQFNNESGGDYSLTVGSYAAGRGLDSTGMDINGVAFAATDVGCYKNPATVMPTIVPGTIAFIGDSIAEGLGYQANIDGWLPYTVVGSGGSSSAIYGSDGNLYLCKKNHTSALDNKPITGVNWQQYWVLSSRYTGTPSWVAGTSYHAASGAAIGGSSGDAVRWYIDRAAVTWAPQYAVLMSWHNNFKSAANSPTNLTTLQASNSMMVAVAKARYWGMTPIVLGQLGVQFTNGSTTQYAKPLALNNILGTACAAASCLFDSPLDRMRFNPNWYNGYDNLSPGYYASGGLNANVHPVAVGSQLVNSVIDDLLRNQKGYHVTQSGTSVVGSQYGPGTSRFPISIAGLNAQTSPELPVGASGMTILAGTNIFTTQFITPADGTAAAPFLLRGGIWNGGAPSFVKNYWSYSALYNVTPSAGTGGVISPNVAQQVYQDDTLSFSITPDIGYSIGATTGTCGGTLVGNTFTTNSISADCTVIANFTPNTYTVTLLTGSNGAISPNTPQAVNYNETTQFIVTSDAGYSIDTISGTCGGTLVNSIYTTNVITANCSVSVIFVQSDFTAPTLSFTDNVETGPVQSDAIAADWGDATIKKWEYNSDSSCPANASSYSKTDIDSMTQNSETNNGKYICLYGEDSLGNKSTLASAHLINSNAIVVSESPAIIAASSSNNDNDDNNDHKKKLTAKQKVNKKFKETNKWIKKQSTKFNRNLSLGSQGNDVKLLQQALQKMGLMKIKN